MSLFATNKKQAPKKLSMLDKATKAAEKAASEWLKNEFFSDRSFEQDKVTSYAVNVLEEHLEKAILSKAGLRTDWNEVRVEHDSPIYDLVVSAAKKQAHNVVSRYLNREETKLGRTLPDKIAKAVNKAYEFAYMEALMEAARERGVARAKGDAEKLLNSYVKHTEAL